MNTETLPPAQDLKVNIKQTHREAEIMRLRAGYDGCGCSECQELYREIDLTKYGKRVIRAGDIVVIVAGRVGADLWDQYHQQERWAGNGFIMGSTLWTVTPAGGICGGPVAETPQDTPPGPQDAPEVVTKLPAKGITPAENPQTQNGDSFDTKHPGGRPRKKDGEEVSRMTQWRRDKEARQGLLL